MLLAIAKHTNRQALPAGLPVPTLVHSGIPREVGDPYSIMASPDALAGTDITWPLTVAGVAPGTIVLVPMRT